MGKKYINEYGDIVKTIGFAKGRFKIDSIFAVFDVHKYDGKFHLTIGFSCGEIRSYTQSFDNLNDAEKKRKYIIDVWENSLVDDRWENKL